MLYLATQFAWFLLAAFGLGFVMGWASHDGSKLDLRSRAVLYALGAVLLVGAVSWFQAINGIAAQLIESALLFVAAYLAGCAAASLWRTAIQPPTLALAGAPRPRPADDATALARTLKEAVVGVKVAEAKLQASLMQDEPLPGEKPAGLPAARDDKPDDLKLIKGVGRQNEGRLHGLGIWHFDQIGAWTADNAAWVGGYLAFPGRIEREDWVGQARLLAAGVETEHARRAMAGEVESSRDDGSAGQGNVARLADGEFDGEKPGNLLEAPRAGGADDLTLIKGVGPAIAADLNRLGIWHFDQIAPLREPEIAYLCAFADVPASAGKTWREDADILRHGGETAHSRAVKAGRGV